MKSAYIVSIGKGLESFIYREVEEMKKRDVDITLYATKYNPNDIFSPKKEWKVEVISYLQIIIAFLRNLISRPFKTIKLLKTAISSKTIIELLIAFDYSHRMKKNNTSHIHCHFGDRKYFIGYYCKELLGLPLSLTVHAHELYANPNEIFFRDSVHKADKIIAISQKNKEILINDFKVDAHKIEVIRLSIDLTNFKKEDKIKILTVARYTERKGFKELFEAIKLLDRDDIEFVTVGFGDIDLNEMAKTLAIEDKVTVFNKMDAKQLRYFYNSCDIFCLPSKSTELEGAEGIPVVLMEAMASEMIIVTTPNGSIGELVDDILVNEGDSKDLVKGIQKAIKLIDRKKEVGLLNRTKVLDEYSEKNIDDLKKYLYE
ncbi:glycosyltransferase family 4 protein [bacterium]|jgi:colanic acid/amylovoran biosynthesis glycosyltransferase|nr:glycosyltransferase family 4 protein [bacterium]